MGVRLRQMLLLGHNHRMGPVEMMGNGKPEGGGGVCWQWVESWVNLREPEKRSQRC